MVGDDRGSLGQAGLDREASSGEGELQPTSRQKVQPTSMELLPFIGILCALVSVRGWQSLSLAPFGLDLDVGAALKSRPLKLRQVVKWTDSRG